MQKLALPPIPKGKHWALGHTPHLVKDILGFFNQVYTMHEDIAYIKAPLGRGEMFVLYHPDAIKYVMVDNQKNYQKGSFFTDRAQPLFGEGLIVSDGDIWKRQRSLMQPVFLKKRVLTMINTMELCIDQMLQQWERDYADGSLINLSKQFDKLALNIVSKSLFNTGWGDDFNKMRDSFNYLLERLLQRLKQPILFPQWLPTGGNKAEKAHLFYIHGLIDRIIDTKQQETTPEQGDMLDLMLTMRDEDTGKPLPRTQIRNEILSLLLAGYETSSKALGFMMELIAKNPEVGEKVDRCIQENNLNSGLEQLKNAGYVKQVTMETLRMRPPASIMQRKALQEDEILGYRVPKGMSLTFPIFVLHHSEKHWDQPYRYNPDRFSKEQIKKRHPYAYFPFGGGARMCMGKEFASYEMMLTLIKIQDKFRFETNDSAEASALRSELTLKPKEDIKLRIYRK